MFRVLLRLLIGLAAFAVFVVIATAGIWGYFEFSSSGTLPNGIAYTKHTMETTRPLTVAEARKHWRGFDFPDSATNVHIAAYHEWQAAEEVVRFEAPVEDCLATAQAILGSRAAEKLAKPIPSVPAEFHPGRTDLQLAPLKAPWFTPSTIRVGTAMHPIGEFKPMIWVDAERGIFYFYRGQ